MTKSHHEKQGEEILRQVKFEKENDWLNFSINVGLVAIFSLIVYFFIH